MDFDYKRSRKIIEDEIARCKPKWEKYLDGLDEHKEGTLAIILENQRLFNEISNSQGALKERSVDIVAKIYREFIGFEVVSVQPMLGPVGLVYFHKFEYEKDPITNENVIDPETKVPVINRNLLSEEIAAKTRMMHARQPLEWTEDNTEAFIQQIREEMTREIFTDLRNNAGTVMQAKPEDLTADKIYSHLMQISGVMHRKTLVSGNCWVVTNPTIGRIMAAHMGADVVNKIEEGYGKKTIINVGYLGMKWKVIIDSLYPNDQILTGVFPQPLDAGYNYCPYIALCACENGALIRYGKKLLRREGAKYYGVINFKEQEEVKKEDE